MSKGYYKSYHISNYRDDDHVIHGGSYSIPASNVDFVTWKKNHETGEFWDKLHTMSGKEVRLKVSYDDLNRILTTCGNRMVHYDENGDENGVEYN